jgi:DNA-binding NarL/FixJ family response regulator
MAKFLVQITRFGFTEIEADSWDDAEDKAADLVLSDFDMSRDDEIEVIDEFDADSTPDYDNKIDGLNCEDLVE